MPIQQQPILFNNSGLDFDISDRFKVPGNSNLILNDIISFVNGEAGARVNMKGNESVHDAGVGVTYIGQVNYVEMKSVIWFIQGTGGRNSIISLNIETIQLLQYYLMNLF